MKLLWGILVGVLLCCAYSLAARTRTAVPVTRLYTGADRPPHAEEMEAKFPPRPGGDLYDQTDMLKATGAQIVRAAPGYVQDWHATPRRQYVITISGRGEVELADGKKIPPVPGGILL